MSRLVNLFLLFLGFLSTGLNGQDIKYAREIIANLCSPEFHGRGYVRQGDQKAANYISKQFEDLGLAPAAKQFQQYFEFPVNSFPGKIELELNGISLVPGKEFIVDPGSSSIKGSFQTAYIGGDLLGNFPRLIDTLKYLSEKIVLIDYHQIFEISDSIRSAIDFIKYNPTLNVKGVIELTHKKLNWSATTKLNPRPVISVIKKLNPDQAGLVYVDIENEFYPNYRSQNVLAMIEGKSRPDSIIMITAHYDHLGRMGEETYFPGANDNASGIAMMLDLARHYSQKKYHPEYTMAFVSFGAEELGLLGSRYFVENPLFDLKRINFLINLDISGTGDDGITVVNGKVHEDYFEILLGINQKKNYLAEVNSRHEACNSDHCFFHQIGIKCFYIYTLGGIQAYHDIYDKAETLPLTAYQEYFKLLREFIDQIQRN